MTDVKQLRSDEAFTPNKFGIKSPRQSSVNASIERYKDLAFNYNKIFDEGEKVKLLEKEIRDERAKWAKSKALLKQQVELLTLQMIEATEREKTLKKNHETVVKALEQKLAEKETSIEYLRTSVLSNKTPPQSTSKSQMSSVNLSDSKI